LPKSAPYINPLTYLLTYLLTVPYDASQSEAHGGIRLVRLLTRTVS